MRRSPGAGNARELRVMDILATEGWLCASRRHIGGAGDILAVRKTRVSNMLYTLEARLIEVKSTAGGPYERFGPADRQALLETAEKYGAEPWLYWWPPRGKLARLDASQFPNPRLQPQSLAL